MRIDATNLKAEHKLAAFVEALRQKRKQHDEVKLS